MSDANINEKEELLENEQVEEKPAEEAKTYDAVIEDARKPILPLSARLLWNSLRKLATTTIPKCRKPSPKSQATAPTTPTTMP